MISTMSASGYADDTAFASVVSDPCCMTGPRTKYQLKVTAAVMVIRPSSAMRVRDATGIGQAGSSRMPNNKERVYAQVADIGDGG